MNKYKLIAIACACILIISCKSKKNEYDPYELTDIPDKEEVSMNTFEIDFKKTANNLKTIHIKFNDTNGHDALFDTGCSGLLISSLELVELFKSNTITENDYLGESYTTIADGSTIKIPRYNIREVSVTDKNGKVHSLRDVEAQIVRDLDADILVGNSIIDNLAKRSYTIDLDKKVIRFQ